MSEQTPDYPDTQLLIDGVWRESADGRRIPVLNPATETVIGHVAHACRADLDEAVAAASSGFEKWRAVSAFDRAAIMRRGAGILRQRAEQIAHAMTLEMGKPLAESRAETLAGADIIEWMADEGRRAYGRVIPSRAGNVLQLVLKQPVGPVAAFTPWNFPINQTVRKLGAALATGCSIIVKAPEEAPSAPAALVRALVDAGTPAGVIGLVYGDPAEISSDLIPRPAIRKISFTGSTAVGKRLAALAGAHMKRVTMELGGHAPVFVFDDADPAAAARLMAASKYRNAGQVCVAPTRFLVQDAVFDQFSDSFREAAEGISVGDGLAPDTKMGPLANKRRVPALESLVQDALDHGAQLVTGASRVGNIGYFYRPTVLANVPANARIMNEEPFGPVAILNRFSNDEEALEEGNRLPFGLASYAFTHSPARAHMLRERLQTGMLSINHLGLALPETPFGGVKDSGYGSEGGSEALDHYFETKFVTQAALPL